MIIRLEVNLQWNCVIIIYMKISRWGEILLFWNRLRWNKYSLVLGWVFISGRCHLAQTFHIINSGRKSQGKRMFSLHVVADIQNTLASFRCSLVEILITNYIWLQNQFYNWNVIVLYICIYKLISIYEI